MTFDEVIYTLQYDYELFKDQPDGSYQLNSRDEIDRYMTKRKYLEHWKPAITAKTLDRWEQRALDIIHVKDPTMALNKYITLTNEFQQFERVTYDAVSQMDMTIEMEIDRMRGK